MAKAAAHRASTPAKAAPKRPSARRSTTHSTRRSAETAYDEPRTARRSAAEPHDEPHDEPSRMTHRSARAQPEASASDDMAAARMPKMLTPEHAIEFYKANARMALDVINAAIEGTEKLRRKQLEGVEQARAFQTRHARTAAQATDPQSLVALGQDAAKEAFEQSMHYWGEMFELIVEMQKRLFTLIEEQSQGLPGMPEAKAAMAMMPDLRQMQNVVSAMQGVMTSGTSAFEGMQRVMRDFSRAAQGGVQGSQR